jgi:hypothetical protein
VAAGLMLAGKRNLPVFLAWGAQAGLSGSRPYMLSDQVVQGITAGVGPSKPPAAVGC